MPDEHLPTLKPDCACYYSYDDDFMLSLDYQNVSVADDIPAAGQVEQWLQPVAALLDGDTALTVRIVDAEEAQQLNHTWRGKAYPTNVLSFPFEMPAGLPPDALDPYLGDLVLCAAVVSREAAEQGKPLDAHWAHLLIHGALHLLGYDHQTEAAAAAMETLETQIVTALGYAPPYQAELQNG